MRQSGHKPGRPTNPQESQLRYKLLTPSGRTRHWILVDGRDGCWHGPNDYTSDGWISRQDAARMLRAWRRPSGQRRGYTISRRREY